MIDCVPFYIQKDKHPKSISAPIDLIAFLNRVPRFQYCFEDGEPRFIPIVSNAIDASFIDEPLCDDAISTIRYDVETARWLGLTGRDDKYGCFAWPDGTMCAIDVAANRLDLMFAYALSRDTAMACAKGLALSEAHHLAS